MTRFTYNYPADWPDPWRPAMPITPPSDAPAFDGLLVDGLVAQPLFIVEANMHKLFHIAETWSVDTEPKDNALINVYLPGNNLTNLSYRDVALACILREGRVALRELFYMPGFTVDIYKLRLTMADLDQLYEEGFVTPRVIPGQGPIFNPFGCVKSNLPDLAIVVMMAHAISAYILEVVGPTVLLSSETHAKGAARFFAALDGMYGNDQRFQTDLFHSVEFPRNRVHSHMQFSVEFKGAHFIPGTGLLLTVSLESRGIVLGMDSPRSNAICINTLNIIEGLLLPNYEIPAFLSDKDEGELLVTTHSKVIVPFMQHQAPRDLWTNEQAKRQHSAWEERKRLRSQPSLGKDDADE